MDLSRPLSLLAQPAGAGLNAPLLLLRYGCPQVEQRPDAATGLTVAVNYWHDMRHDARHAYRQAVERLAEALGINALPPPMAACSAGAASGDDNGAAEGGGGYMRQPAADRMQGSRTTLTIASG